MKQFTVNIQDDQTEFFKELMRRLRFVDSVKEEPSGDVSGSKQEDIGERVDKNPDDYSAP
ncbi:MAG: hypothetical protein ACLFPE_13375 [Bacteroidales bacterium]